MQQIQINDDDGLRNLVDEHKFLIDDPLEATLTLDFEDLDEEQREMYGYLDTNTIEDDFMSDYEEHYAMDIEETRDESKMSGAQMTVMPTENTNIDYIITYDMDPSNTVGSLEDIT